MDLPEGFQISLDLVFFRSDFGAEDLATVATSRSTRTFTFLAGFLRLSAAAFFAASCRVEVFLPSVLLRARSRSSFRARGFLLEVVEEEIKPFRYFYVR